MWSISCLAVRKISKGWSHGLQEREGKLGKTNPREGLGEERWTKEVGHGGDGDTRVSQACYQKNTKGIKVRVDTQTSRAHDSYTSTHYTYTQLNQMSNRTEWGSVGVAEPKKSC